MVNIKYDIPLRGHSIQKDVPASECLLAVEDSGVTMNTETATYRELRALLQENYGG